MSDINLLPERERATEQKEHAQSQRVPVSRGVEFTPGAASALPSARGGNFFRNLFRRVPSAPAPAKTVAAPTPQPSSTDAVERSRSAGSPATPKAIIPSRSGAPSEHPEDHGLGVASAAMAAPSAPQPARQPVPAEDPRITASLEKAKPLPGKPKSWSAWLSRHDDAAQGDIEPGKPPMTSLLPKEYLRASHHTLAYFQLSIAFVVSGGVVALSLWLLLGYETAVQAQLDQARANGVTADGQVAALERQKNDALVLQHQIAAARALVDAHIQWTKALAFLESKTVPDVQFTALAVDAQDGRANIQAIGASFAALARQLLVFQNSPEIQRVTITSGKTKGDTQGIEFDIELRFSPEVLRTGSATSVTSEHRSPTLPAAPVPVPATP